jgi:2-desacetyl-2-hydroxyethyl bacteriochlorophyllide A dehydrogenase
MNMKTITLDSPGQFSTSETERPSSIGPGEALVRVARIGICGTDLHAYRGRQPFFTYPRILGHELGVEVLDVGANGEGISVGDHCAVEPYLNCGECIACRNGKPNCCADLKVLGVHVDGGMRETIVVPIVNLHKSESLALDQLALVETLGIGAHAVSRAKPQAGENVLVIGAGPIGLSVVQFATVEQVNVAVLDMNAARLEFCSQQFGIERTIVLGDDAASQVAEVFEGEMPTLVFDATGNRQSMEAAFGLVANGGRLTLVGLVQDDISFHDPEFHRKELTVLSSRNSTPDDFRRIIRLMEAGTIDTTPWITHRASLDEMIGQFEGWLSPEAGVIKAMIEV